jgi:hypothetical protein
MLDDLRNQAESSYTDNIPDFLEEEIPNKRSSRYLLGMSPAQRFFISLMLLITVCLLGTMFLLVSGRFMLF